jgi:hypothetical protein
MPGTTAAVKVDNFPTPANTETPMTTMTKSTKKVPARISSIKIKSNIRGGGLNGYNHNRRISSIKVKSNIRGGGLNAMNHSRSLAR